MFMGLFATFWRARLTLIHSGVPVKCPHYLLSQRLTQYVQSIFEVSFDHLHPCDFKSKISQKIKNKISNFH